MPCGRVGTEETGAQEAGWETAVAPLASGAPPALPAVHQAPHQDEHAPGDHERRNVTRARLHEVENGARDEPQRAQNT